MYDQLSATFELWKGLTPADAYLSGSDDQGGMLFIPSRENKIARRRELESIWRSTQNVELRSLLKRARCYLDLQEPHKPPMDIIDAFTFHFAKGGIDNPHLHVLIQNSLDYMEHAVSGLKLHRWPMEMHVLTLYRTGILRSFLDLLPKSGIRTGELEDLRDKVGEYAEMLPLSELIGEPFEEMVISIGEGDGHLGRRDVFPRILGEIYEWPDRYDVIEEKILMGLYRELPHLKRSSSEVKDIYDTSMDSEEIADAIAGGKTVRNDELIQIAQRLKDRLAFWGVRRVMDYPHERDTGMIETPEYLLPIIGSGGYVNTNGFTGKPVNDLYISTNRISGRPWSYPELLQLLITEEMGYRAHYLNSFLRPYRDVRKIDLLPGSIMNSTMGAFAQVRLLEVIDLLKDMITRGKELHPGERRFLEHIQESYPVKEIVAEMEFLVRRDRVLDLLAGVADIRINTGNQSITEFIRWANIITGIEKHVLIDSIPGPISVPGHHASLQMISIDLESISRNMRRHGVTLKDFNTQSTRMGFSSWRYLRTRIEGI